MPIAIESPPVHEIATYDGSVTLQRADSGLAYRSVHGAWRESQRVFVGASAIGCGQGPRAVLELGFGAATNFAATVVVRRGRGPLRYEAVDDRPVAPEDLPRHDARAHLLSVVATRNGSAHGDDVALTLHRVSFESYASDTRFDAVYFDPFGPSDQPDSWSVRAFEVARAHLRPDGRLVTYSTAGWVRRNMAVAGLYVATIPGPSGKRDTTVAASRRDALGDLRIRNVPA
jgi:tRNA U34 5-methylaminomethyl-2-thiouridine-forming methyltransferase MnmC